MGRRSADRPGGFWTEHPATRLPHAGETPDMSGRAQEHRGRARRTTRVGSVCPQEGRGVSLEDDPDSERFVVVIGAVDMWRNTCSPRSAALWSSTRRCGASVGESRPACGRRPRASAAPARRCTGPVHESPDARTAGCTSCSDVIRPTRGCRPGRSSPHAWRACILIRLVSSLTWLNTARRSARSWLILRSAYMTVVWSRLPNWAPILGSERSVSSRHRYIAI